MRWWLWAFLASMCFFAGAESVVCEDPETAGEGATEARTVNENCRASALNNVGDLEVNPESHLATFTGQVSDGDQAPVARPPLGKGKSVQ